jgi:LPXTG-site transpeptidase (sortase) family protein
VFTNNTSPTAAGQGRVTVRHAAAAPAVDVLAGGQPAFTNLASGQEGSADLPAGTVSASVVPTGASEPVVLGPTDLAIEDGTALIVYAVGSLENQTMNVLTERITGLSTAPTAVNTGNSPVEETTGVWWLWVALAGVSLATASLRIDPLGVDVPVTAVGVEDDGELAVPGPADVGWYRFGPAPGEEGTTVLAAHVAYDGVDGVFRHLDDLEPGDTVVVDLAGGATMTYQVERVETYPKDGPPDALWWRTGPPRLALVTCGGTFDTERRSYDSNVVAWATSR